LPWEIERVEAFEKALKELHKKFPNAERDILDAFKSGHPPRTDALPSYEKKLWKGRVACTDARRSPPNGFRVIYYWDENSPNLCCFGTAYFKGDCEDLPKEEVKKLFVKLQTRFQRLMEEKNKAAQAPPPVLPDNQQES
jgi:mRNA-degrading endonuclease RelE of RelBE toxin-antitoxin system